MATARGKKKTVAKKPQNKKAPKKAPVPAAISAQSSPADRLKKYQFKKGQSGNPSGRPKTAPLTEAYKRILSLRFPGDKQKRTYAEVIAMAGIAKALKGNHHLIIEVTDRVEGKSVARTEISGPNGGPVDISNLTPEERDQELKILMEELYGGKK